MESFVGLLGLVQVFFAVVIGLYFFNLLKNQQTNKVAVDRESKKEMEQLERMRRICLSEPLAEKTRPASFQEIIGQENSIKALRAALCGPNPQHVLMYGPPGVGKTAAARLVLEEAKQNPESPFKPDAKFIELDATTARFDERGIADPLIGTVHDPIYQGAGPLGVAGIPQPKAGAVTKAHGGLLFIDEIGELHNIQINKLLKVLEDRKVFLESSYYNSEDTNIPRHIHEIFLNGLPADFRLIGATTRNPADIPPAIRSRCLEIFFRGLQPGEINTIAKNAVAKMNLSIQPAALEVIKGFATNGREGVNIVQMSAGIAGGEDRQCIEAEDVEWVVNSSQLSPRPEKKVPECPGVGCVNGLAVYGPNMGTLMEIEVSVYPAERREGLININGIIEEEEMGTYGKKMRRKSTAKGAVDTVMTILNCQLGINLKDYHIHLNFPCGVPVDGPSAGVGMAVAIYSALYNIQVNPVVAMTGELSARGEIRPVGGIIPKLEAAREAGVKKVLLPRDNWQKTFDGNNKRDKDMDKARDKDRDEDGDKGMVIVPVKNLSEVWEHVLLPEEEEKRSISVQDYSFPASRGQNVISPPAVFPDIR